MTWNVEFSKKMFEFMRNPNAIIWLQDEVHFKVKSTIKAAWFKKGSRPCVNSNPGQQKVSYSGFVNPKSGHLITVKVEVFNYETMRQQ